jgi:hypothetical protein
MGLQYSHLLIPDTAEFIPKPAQVTAFLESLVSLGSAPLEATIRVGKRTSEFHTGTNPLTGTPISVPKREFRRMERISEVSHEVLELDDYIILMEGKGPPRIAPFTLYTVEDSVERRFSEEYWYGISCNLREEVVSTCETPPFETPCKSQTRLGIFRDPRSGATIQVANSSCARFWLEFQFGKWLFPRANGNLNLLEPSILKAATDAFGRRFVQGCFWG